MMPDNVAKEVAALPRMGVPALRTKYAELFGDEARTRNKAWLVKRLAWRIQCLAEGGLSERARQRAAELACDADLRSTQPCTPKRRVESDVESPATVVRKVQLDDRLPPPGTVLTRQYKGESVQVVVRDDGLEYAGEIYASLSAVAKAITGSHCNGYLFFLLSGKGDA
jgi:hypothetical protein